MTNDDLLARHCQPLEGHPPMPTDEITARLAQVPGWRLHDGAI